MLSGSPDHVLVAVENAKVWSRGNSWVGMPAPQQGEKAEAAVVRVPTSHLPASLLRGRNTFQRGGGIHVKRGCLTMLFLFSTNVDV